MLGSTGDRRHYRTRLYGMTEPPAPRGLAEYWLNLPLPGKGVAIVAIPVVCTMSMLLVLADLRGKADKANQWLTHTEEVLAQSSQVLASSLSEEATARGYLLTHDPAFLTLHHAARKRVFDGFSRILSATQDNSQQQDHMRRAMRLMQEEDRRRSIPRSGCRPRRKSRRP